MIITFFTISAVIYYGQKFNASITVSFNLSVKTLKSGKYEHS